MAEMADKNVFQQLVTGLCNSIAVVKEEPKDDFELDELESSIPSDQTSADQTLAVLLEMGYDFEAASKSMRHCGSLDLATLLDYLNPGTPNATPSASDDSSTVLKSDLVTRPLLEVKEEEGCMSDVQAKSRLGQSSNGEASTSCGKVSQEFEAADEMREAELLHSRREDEFPHTRISLGRCSSSTRNKGKAPVTESDEDDEDEVDLARWERAEISETDKAGSLVRIGFSVKNVADALQACDETATVNDLANYIISNIVDHSENDESWDDDFSEELMDEENLFRKGQKSGKKWEKEKEVEDGSSDDWSEEEASDHRALVRIDGEGSSDDRTPVAKNLETMGFSVREVSKAIKACGKEATEDALLEFLLNTSPPKCGGEESDEDGGDLHNMSTMEQLRRLSGRSTAACARAIDNNGNADISELLDYMEAEKLDEAFKHEEVEDYKRRFDDDCSRKLKRQKVKGLKVATKKKEKGKKIYVEEEEDEDDEHSTRFHRNLKGFGLPGEPVIPRVLSLELSGPPFFYFENVALTPKDEWAAIQRHLYNIAPEFVDSLNFSPCRRPRGYIHNLPIEGRQDLLPRPPMSVQELIRGSAQFWPEWDPRVKLNTINTRVASDFVNRQIKQSMKAYNSGNLSPSDKKTILFWARRWNLVWISPGVLAPLTPEEIEICLGFDVDHTRVLYSPTDRVKLLGNTFQINTVAFHLSVLRPRYLSSGIRVLSLFSGIGGAEVALHKLGIPLKLVVSVEIEEKARTVVEQWWKSSNQTGTLIHNTHDVKKFNSEEIQTLVDRYGGFDLVIGGSPCNNLSGNNRCTRVGLAGSASIAFFEFPRILDKVRECMAARGRR